MNFFVRTFKHLHTVDHHRFLVMVNCFKCGLYLQGLTHDLSKYGPTEFWESVKYYQGTRSPYSYEKEVIGYANGWMHHKGHNKHHWEYWYDIRNNQWTALEMPYNYLVEMVCDRISACKTYAGKDYTQSHPLNYYNKSKDHCFMNDKTAHELEKILTDISIKGEDVVLAELKQKVKEYRKQQKNHRK